MTIQCGFTSNSSQGELQWIMLQLDTNVMQFISTYTTSIINVLLPLYLLKLSVISHDSLIPLHILLTKNMILDIKLMKTHIFAMVQRLPL